MCWNLSAANCQSSNSSFYSINCIFFFFFFFVFFVFVFVFVFFFFVFFVFFFIIIFSIITIKWKQSTYQQEWRRESE